MEGEDAPGSGMVLMLTLHYMENPHTYVQTHLLCITVLQGHNYVFTQHGTGKQMTDDTFLGGGEERGKRNRVRKREMEGQRKGVLM